jgi:hypothetical protein
MTNTKLAQIDGEVLKPDTDSTMIPSASMQRILNSVASHHNHDIFRDIIDNVLSSYGHPIMSTIQWHLKASGVIPNARTPINIPMFHKALQQITGDVANIIWNDICARLDKACEDHNLVHGDLADECPFVPS